MLAYSTGLRKGGGPIGNDCGSARIISPMPSKKRLPPHDTAPSGSPAKPVKAVLAAVRLLHQLSEADRPLGVNRIAREAGLYPGTCFAILRTMVSEGLVSFDEETKTYRLGDGLVKLAAPMLQQSSHVARFQPHLARIARAHHVSTALFQISSRHMIMLDFALSGSDIQIHHRVGTRFPLLFGATGRWYAFRSGLSRGELRQEYRRVRMDRPPSFESWIRDCKKAHRRGFGVDRGESRANITVVAAPVLEVGGRIVLSMTAAGLSAAFSGRKIAAVGRDLVALAKAGLEPRIGARVSA